MKKYICLILSIFIVVNLIAQTSDIIEQAVPIEITNNTGLIISNRSTYGVTLALITKSLVGKEVTIPMKINTDIAPTWGFSVDLKHAYKSSYASWAYTIHMIGTDNKDHYFWTFQFQKSFGVIKYTSVFNTPNSGYGSDPWKEIVDIPEEFSAVMKGNDLHFLQEYITPPNENGIQKYDQYGVRNIKGITGITLKVDNGLSLRVQNPTIILPSAYANNFTRKAEVAKRGEYISSGSGFVITTDGIIVTNYHVIDEANGIDVYVNLNGKVQIFKAKVLVSDKTNDISLLQIDDNAFTKFPALPYAVKMSIQDVGTNVFTLGYPMSNILGEEIKVTDGIINSKTGYQGDIVTYQISAPIQAGNSGGPLFDKQGYLVGITNAGVPDAQNVGYAIKTSYLKNLIDVAPIPIALPIHNTISGLLFTEKIKKLSPYVVLIKVY